MAPNLNTEVAVHNMSPDHLEAFNQTLRHVLSIDLATHALAQIAEGLPTRDVYYNYAHYHADIDNHLKPNPEAVKIVKTLQEDFRPDTLYIDSDVGCWLHLNGPRTLTTF